MIGDTAMMPGARLGVYRIQERIGVGGMGEVYRAHDTKLGRDVAIKILPRAFVGDPDRLARFEREARVLASLNHPNIGAIHGVEEDGGIRGLVLELIDGETLADRIGHGPIPIADAVRIGLQIADALDAAHEKGVIHRDLKPSNIKVTAAGVVKVLDFGLAKAITNDGASDASQVATITLNGTRAGLIVGTPAYMSPEQARGTAIDKRTDIWAFGCVLYEMLTGRATFARDTITDTLAAVVEREPDWSALPSKTPPAVRHLLRRCLDKNPTQRLRDIGEVRVALGERAVRQPLWHPAYRAAGLLILALSVVAGAVAFFYSPTRVPTTSPFEYAQITNFTDSAVAPSLSPDGRMVTFMRGGDAFLSRGQIYVKLLPNGESVQLTTDGGLKFGPVFTPDGSRIAYTRVTRAGWDTWTVPVLGGQPTQFLPNASGLTWIDDRRILFAEIKTGLHMGIVTSTESRAERREIYFPANERAMAHYAYPSPDRRSVLVVEMDGSHHFSQPCRLLPFDGSSAGRQVGPRGTCTSAAWSPDGEWMYFGAAVGGSSHIWRQRFPDGVPEQITFGPTEEEGVALGPDGRSLVTSLGTERSAIWIHDAAGERPITSEGYARLPRLSRDGGRVFYLLQRDSSSSSGELRAVDLGSGKIAAVLPGASVTDYDMSRDETEVAYTTTDGSGEPQIWLASLDRRSAPRQIARAGDQVSFGGDGDLIFRSLEENTNSLVRIKRDGSGRAGLTTVPMLDKYGVSPDGKWISIFSPGTGEDAEPVTLAVPVDGGVPVRICFPSCPTVWSVDGRFLYLPIAWGPDATAPRKTAAIPVPAGKSLPDLPPAGIDASQDEVTARGARVIEQRSISPGPDPSTYVFAKSELQRNLFRIPLH